MKHKVGDRVKIRLDLDVDTRYEGVPFREEMHKLCGQYVTIDQVFDDEDGVSYYIEEDQNFYYWTDEMFENRRIRVSQDI